MKEVDYSQFTLKKAKKIKGDGLEVEFDVAEQIGKSHYSKSEKVVSTKLIHPDLQKIFESFKPFLSANLGYDRVRKVVHNPSFKATDAQVKIAEKEYQEIFDNIVVNGISISRDANSIVIIGKNTLNGTPIAINSTALRFDTSHGYEQEIESLVEELKTEVFQFIYKNKVSDPELGLE